MDGIRNNSPTINFPHATAFLPPFDTMLGFITRQGKESG
jgi:hypothetical protein